MGLLISSLWRRLFTYKEFKVSLIGLDNAGKTTILFQLHMGEVVETQPTLGSNVEEVVHKNIRMIVWDLGGQESLRHGWSTYFEGSHAIILVVDSTDIQRMPKVKEELNRIIHHPHLTHAAILVYANKQDFFEPRNRTQSTTSMNNTPPNASSTNTSGSSSSSISGTSVNSVGGAVSSSSSCGSSGIPCLSSAEIAEHLDLQSIKTHSWHIQACCALTGEGLYEGIEWLTQAATKT